MNSHGTGRLLTGILLAAVALVTIPAEASAQLQIKSKALEVKLTGRVHTQFNTTSVDNELASEFLIRRARFTAEVKIDDLISGKVQPDYGSGKISLKDAYFRLSFDPALRATIGQFKRPFDLFELTSSTQILVIERAGSVRGVDACAGPGGVCSFSRLTEKLGFSDRDIGIMFDGRDRSETIRYMASITNGTGANKPEENGTKSLSGRLEITPAQDLKISANVGLHDYFNQVADDDRYATAFGGDVEWGKFSEGPHLQIGIATGDNWKNLDAGGEPRTFVTTQGVITYRLPVSGDGLVEAVEPVGRISWADPDTNGDGDDGILITPGFVVHFSGRNKIAVNADIWAPAEGDTQWGLVTQAYLHF